MGSIKEYIENLKFEDIPWEKMVTAYGTAEKFPEFFSVLEKMQNIDEIEEAFYGIMKEVEHQDTLFQPLPFVMILFKRLLKKAENIHTPEAEWLAEEIQHIFKRILDTCDYNAYEFPHGLPFLNCSELLDEKYFPPNYYYLESAGEIDPLDYEHSVVYYTKKIINEDF